VARQLTKGKGFELSIGGGLLKSGKPTLLTTRGGQLFVFEYTDAQVKACKLKDRSIIFKETIDHRGPIRATPDVELSDLRIDGADEIDPIKRVTGKVAYRVLGQSNGNLALRIVRCPGKKPQTGIIYLDGDTLSKKSGTLSFSIAEFADAGGVSAAAIPVFVEMIAMAEPRRPDKATVISNILVTIFTIAPGTVP